MSSVILKLASRHLKWIMLVFSLFILFRGHNQPGGGFIGGMLAGCGILFDALANKVDKVNNTLLIKPFSLFAIGLLICFASAVPGIFVNNALLSGIWAKQNIFLVGEMKIGTPLLFDLGIYMVVTGSFLLIVFSIMEEMKWK